MNKLLLSLSFSLVAHSAWATGVKILERKDENHIIRSDNCHDTLSCGLKRVFFQNLTKEITVKNEKYYATDSRFGYETESAFELEDFVIVQLIKGCVFSTYISKQTGAVTKVHDALREFWGNPNFRFIHKDWVIDNTDPSPVYTSFGLKGDHALLRWNTNPRTIDPNSSTYYFKQKPSHNTVYATDMPSPSYVYETALNEAQKISSLKLRTCLIHKSFVDMKTSERGEGIEWDKAVKCYDWDHNFRYDETLKKIVVSKDIDPFCK